MSETRSIAVLMYHHVGPERHAACRGLSISAETFARHVTTLSAMGYTAITPDDWVAYVHGAREIPERCVMITFDDAYEDLVEHALPCLEKKSFPATVFVATSLIGKTLPCNPREPDATLKIMTEAQIREWHGRGVIFGAHSRSHVDLSSVPMQLARGEIVGSQQDLVNITGGRVGAFAYPYGKFNDEVESVVDECFDIAFTIEEGMNDPATPLCLMKRTMVQHGDSIVDLLLRARSGKSVLQRIKTAVLS
jgi:peptidoglycan/xylan/chitin deacetylase (PgdA/CDA1 family)